MKKISLVITLAFCAVLAGCTSQSRTDTVTRSMIETTLKVFNTTVNNRPNTSVEETIAGIDVIMAPDVEGWENGVYIPDREADRQTQRWLLATMHDYHRSFEHVVIDPPYGAFDWTITGTAFGKPVEFKGCTIMEFDSEGKIRRYWLYSPVQR